MSDQELRELERRYQESGTTAAAEALYRAKQRSCTHSWRSLGIFKPGTTTLDGGLPNLGEVRVDICWGCHLTRVIEGQRLCMLCDEPSNEEEQLVRIDPNRDGLLPVEWQEWVHPSCDRETGRGRHPHQSP